MIWFCNLAIVTLMLLLADLWAAERAFPVLVAAEKAASFF
jgi:hypothetical protein